MLRYGVIGTGMMGVEHIMNINHIEGVAVTAVADPHGPSLTAGANAADGPVETFEHHKDLLNSGLVDAVVVASPNMTHASILDDVWDYPDLHVLIEKPMCTTVEDAQRVVEAAARRDGLVWVAMEYRYMAPIARLVEEVQNGTVGDLRMLTIREHRFPFLQKIDNWNRFRANSGGTLVEKCCHYFDLMNLISDATPKRIYAVGGQDVNHLDEVYDGRPSDILDNAYVTVEYDNGARAMLELSMFAEATRNQEELSAVGNRGKVEALIPTDVVRIGSRGTHFIGEVDEHVATNTHLPYQGHHRGSSYVEHLKFIEAIETGRPPEVSATDGLIAVAMGVAGHRSIETGLPVDLADVL